MLLIVSVGLCHALLDLKCDSWKATMKALLELHGANEKCNWRNMSYPVRGVAFRRFENFSYHELGKD